MALTLLGSWFLCFQPFAKVEAMNMTTVCFNYFYIPRNTSMTEDQVIGLQEFLLLLLVMAMDCHLSFQQMLADDGRYCCSTKDVELVQINS